FLYCGLMLTPDGPKVIEFNVRFGDPEAQVVLPLIVSPLAPVLRAAAEEALGDHVVRVQQGACVGVVLASGGYPGPVVTGRPITGIADADAMDHVRVFHAGTARRDGTL